MAEATEDGFQIALTANMYRGSDGAAGYEVSRKSENHADFGLSAFTNCAAFIEPLCYLIGDVRNITFYEL